MPSRVASVYQAKYGWSLRPVIFTGIFIAVCVAGLVAPGALWLRIVVAGVFGLLALLTAATELPRRTALRIDSSGVTLRQYTQQPRSAAFCPWEDVEKLLIWQSHGITYVGVKRREGAARPCGLVTPASRAGLAARAPGIPLDVAATAAPVQGWSLDPQRLADAVARFAATVDVAVL
jgi:hypothetical protein